MQIDFANAHLQRQCRALMQFESEQWRTVPPSCGAAMWSLERQGLVIKRKLNRLCATRNNNEYKLTPAGVQVAGVLRRLLEWNAK